MLLCCAALQGSRCPDAYVEAAKRAAGGLARYEAAAALSGIAAQGAETRAVRDALSLPGGFQAQENRAYDSDYRVSRQGRRVAASVDRTRMHITTFYRMLGHCQAPISALMPKCGIQRRP